MNPNLNMYGVPPLNIPDTAEEDITTVPGQEVVPTVGREQPAGEIPISPDFGPRLVPVEDMDIRLGSTGTRNLDDVEVLDFDFSEGQLPPNPEALPINRRIRRLSPIVESTFEGSVFDPNSTETSDVLAGKGIGAFGFTETKDEVQRLYEGIHGEGRVRVFEDTEAGVLEPRFYVSLQKDDGTGTFTPFSSPVQDTYDYAKLLGSVVGYETAVGSASVATAWAVGGTVATAMGVTALTTVAAPVVAGAAVLYTLYAMGGSAEKFKQEVLKDEIGLTDREADETENFFAEAFKVYNEGLTPVGLGGEEFTSGEKFAGLTELAVGIPGMILDKIRLSKGRLRRKFVKAQQGEGELPTTFESAVQASDFADKEGLVGLTVAQVKDNRIIERVEALASQTSIIIPTQLRKQAESAVAYLRKYGDDLGEGNFAQFQDDLDALQNFWSANRDRTPDYESIGTSMVEIDRLFGSLRFAEAQGMYARVFDAVGDRSYDLSTIIDTIRANTRDVIPEKTDGTISGAQMPYQRGEAQVFDTLEILKTIGTNKDGTLTSGAGLRAAVKQFNEVNPGYEISLKDGDVLVDSPAKLLQMFAIRFGEMGSDIRKLGQDAPAATKKAGRVAIETRRALLKLIGNPNGADEALKKQIAQDLNEANTFYSNTLDTREAAQIQDRLGMPGFTDPASFAKEVLLKSRGDAAEGLLEAINKQTEYIKSRIPTANPQELEQLKIAFKQLLDIETARTLPGEAGEPTNLSAARAFLDNFSDTERARLGFTTEMVDERLREADFLAEMASGNFATMTGKYSAASTKFMKVFSNAFADGADTNTELFKLIQVVTADTAGAGGMENLRKGLFDYLVSTESGVLKEVTKNTATSRVGTRGNPNYEIDAPKLADLLTKMNESMPELRKILTDRDVQMLEGLSVYVSAISRSGADAGSALSGAQIIGELFTVDPAKFGRGLARLGAQKRMSQLLTNPQLVNTLVGLGQSTKTGGFADTVRTYFAGKGAVGAIVADLATTPQSEDEQMQDMFGDMTINPLPMYDLEATQN